MRPFDPALLRALPATRGPVVGLSVVGVLSGVVAIAQAVVLALAVSRVVTGGPLTPVLTWLVALMVARGLLAGLTELVARWAGLRVVGIVRLATLRRWLARPEGARPPTEVAVTRAGEGVSALEAYVSRYLPALVSAAVVPALAVLVLLWVDPWSALIVLLTLPLLPVFAALIGLHTQDETEQRWEAMAHLAGHFLDVVRGLPTLVGYGRAEAQVGVVRAVGDRHRRATMRTLRTAFLSTAALELLATISVAMVAVAVGLRLAYGQMDLLVGLTAILLAPEAYWPVRRVGQEFHNAADGATVLEELAQDGILAQPDEGGAPGEAADRERLAHAGEAADRDRLTHTDRPTDTDEAAAAPGTTVRLDQVSYAHPGRERTIVDLTLTTGPGPGLTALVGPSGAGKTTVLELLAGLRTPDAGQVSAPSAHLAAQRPVILPGTVRDNLALVGHVPETRMTTALDRVGLWEQLTERAGLDTVLGDDGFGLSAGQRARLALARALLSPAPLVLLDEPTANVAAASIPTLHEVITDLARQRRVIVVTHDPDLARQADETWHLEPAELPARSHAPEVALDRLGAGAPGTDTRGTDTRGTGTRDTGTRDTNAPDTGTPLTTAGTATADATGTGGDAARHTGLGSTPETPTGDDTASDAVPGQVKPLPVPRGRPGLVLACLLGGASVACGVALTATSGWLIVQASTMPVVLTLLVAIVGVRAFGLFRPVFRYAERVVSHDVALADLADRRAQVFARLIPLTPARLGRRSRGEVLTAVVRDLDDVIDEQVRVTVPAWSAVIATIVGAVLAAWHVPWAGAAVAVGGLLTLGVALIGYAAERAAQDAAVERRGAVQHGTTALVGRLLPVQAVTGLAADPAPLLAPIAAAEADHRRAEHRLITVRAAVLLAAWLVVAGTNAVVITLTWQAHADGLLSGPFAALVALVPMALADAWVGGADIAGAKARAQAAGHRLTQVLGQRPAVAAARIGARPHTDADARTGTHPHPRSDPRTGGTPYLHLDGVGAAWDHDPTRGTGEEAAGRDLASLDLVPLDLDLPPGSRVALTGPNGAGKSTALAVLARHLDPVTGHYHLDRQDVTELDLDATRSLIATVDDEPHAFAGSVRANLTLAAPDAEDAELLAALDAVDLGHWYDTLPEGLDTPLTGLSGGERSRLSIARALLSGRPVVLLDEPTAHLDEATAERALAGLRTSRPDGEGIIVMISHRPGARLGWTTEEVELRPARAAQTALIR